MLKYKLKQLWKVSKQHLPSVTTRNPSFQKKEEVIYRFVGIFGFSNPSIKLHSEQLIQHVKARLTPISMWCGKTHLDDLDSQLVVEITNPQHFRPETFAGCKINTYLREFFLSEIEHF